MEDKSRRFGRKMYLISPLLYDSLRKNQNSPYYRNNNAKDLQVQKKDKEIFDHEIDKKNKLEKTKRELSDLLKPILTSTSSTVVPSSNPTDDSKVTSIDSSVKENLKQILGLLSELSSVSITKDNIKIDDKTFLLQDFIEDIVSKKKKVFKIDFEVIVNALAKAKVNPDLIPNQYLKEKLYDKEDDDDDDDDNDDDDDDDNDDNDKKKKHVNTILAPKHTSTPNKTDFESSFLTPTSTLDSKSDSRNKTVIDHRKEKKDLDGSYLSMTNGRKSSRDTKRPTKYGKGWRKF